MSASDDPPLDLDHEEAKRYIIDGIAKALSQPYKPGLPFVDDMTDEARESGVINLTFSMPAIVEHVIVYTLTVTIDPADRDGNITGT